MFLKCCSYILCFCIGMFIWYLFCMDCIHTYSTQSTYIIIFVVSCCIYDICVCMCVCVHYSCMCRSPSACRCSCCSFSASEVFMNYVDVLVTVASFVEVIFFWAFRTEMGVNPMYSSCTILSCMSCNSLPCDPSHSRD